MSASTVSKPSRPFLSRLPRVINPVVLRLARFIPLYVVLEHHGRRSGRTYRTPLAGVRTGDGFVLPLAFGDEPHWVRNLVHSGAGMLEWRGKRFLIAEPAVVDWDEGSRALTARDRRFAPVFGVKRFLRVKAEPSA